MNHPRSTTRRIGVVTNRNLASPWASTHFYIHRALLRTGSQVQQVAGKMVAAHHSGRGRGIFGRRATAHPGKRLDPFAPTLVRAVMEDIQAASYDALIALHASTIVPSIQFAGPLIYVTDATARLLHDYYPIRTDLSSDDQRYLQECEQRTIARASAVVVPTQWAADSVLAHYGADPAKVHVIEWGANLERSPDAGGERASSAASRPEAPYQFLFVGFDWDRKGGDRAVDIVHEIRAAGHDAELTVVGCRVPRAKRRPYIKEVGRLSRAIAAESQQLDELFRQADLLLHPARAECYGHVLCEAQAFGVPVVATRTGGIAQCVVAGETGLLFSEDSPIDRYVTQIIGVLQNPSQLHRMSQRAIQEYESRLNWDRWAQLTVDLLEVPSAPASPGHAPAVAR
jgi:glycosyltransferase involved in cell wall biosynthesis